VHDKPADNDINNIPIITGKPGLKQTWNEKVQWPGQEHGVSVDEKNNTVWVVGWMAPSQVLKFTRDGKFLMRIGQAQAKSVTDPVRENMAGPTQAWPDPDTNEVYVADGYHNRRVAVFDMTTGKLKREWGAYGNKPSGNLGGLPVEENHPPQDYPIYPQRHSPPPPDFKDDPATRSKQFATVHCITMSRDKILYVCDRVNNRVQAFKADGTYLMENVVAPRTRGWGSVHGMTVSSDPGQKWVYVADGGNHTVWILRRSDLKVLGRLGHGGRQHGEFSVAHSLAVDSKNNLYVAETQNANRIQKFTFMGAQAAQPPATE
jgi:DNA-binding beta-propeller fold protein YncE